MLRVHFKDEGQDILWWDIDNDGVVQACNMQEWVWKGTKVVGFVPHGRELVAVLGSVHNLTEDQHYVEHFVDVKPGDELVCAFKRGNTGRFIHPVEKVEYDKKG